MLTCSVKELTGFDCPGCGGQRAIYALLEGKFLEAFKYNELIYFYIVVITYLYINIIERYVVKDIFIIDKIKLPSNFALAFLFIIFVFTIARNY